MLAKIILLNFIWLLFYCSVYVAFASCVRDYFGWNPNNASVVGDIRRNNGICSNCDVVAYIYLADDLGSRANVDFIADSRDTLLFTAVCPSYGYALRNVYVAANYGLVAYHYATEMPDVETFANVAWIIDNGGEAFAAMGTENSKGTKVFALTGKINRGGLVEIPMGRTLRDVIFGIGGGIRGGARFKAVQLGGPSGGCVPAERLDVQIDYNQLVITGAIMGSGGMVVMDENTCMVNMARFFLDFTTKESCGKCVHCRLGTKRMKEILDRIVEGKGEEGDIEKLEDLCNAVKDGALCGLGNTAPNPVLTTIRYFREEFEAHIEEHRCPAGECRALISYNIDPDKCIGCTACARQCPVDAIKGEVKGVHEIDHELCTKCGNCKTACRFDAVVVR